MSAEPLPDDYYYDAKTFAREPPPTELPASFAPLYHSFAFESAKRSNLYYLDEGATLMHARRSRGGREGLARQRHAPWPRPAPAGRRSRPTAPPPPLAGTPRVTTCTSSTWRR